MAVIEAIETIYLETDAVASVTTGTLPTDYEHLQVRISLRSEDASVTAGKYGDVKIRFNSAATPAYWFHLMYGGDPYATGSNAAAVYKATAGAAKGGFAPRSLPASRSDSADYGGFIIDVLDYRNTNKNTTFSVVQGKAPGGGEPVVLFGGGMWTSAVEVTTLTFISSDGWNRGSQFTVYGITG